MRDAHRMKEKFDVSLDNRHLVSLLIAGIVVFGAVFILGVVVGKKLAGNEHAVQAPDLLDALDQKAAAVEQKDPAYTFHEELTKKTVAKSPSNEAPLARREEAASLPKEGATLDSPAAKPSVATDATAVSTVGETGPPAVKELGRPVRRAEVKTVSARAPAKERSLRETISRIERKPTAEHAEAGRFTLQVSATQARPEAERLMSRLKDKGYSPFMVQAQVPGRGRWYRVRLGNFATKDAATGYLADFRRETRLDAFVTNQ